MANQSNENGELFELIKDVNGSSANSEHFDLENQLSSFSNVKAPSHLKNAILTKTAIERNSFVRPTFLLIAAAIFMIVSSGYYFMINTKKESTIIDTPNQINNDIKIASIIDKELGTNSSKPQKYYALYFSSSLCKPCVDFLNELDRFYIEQKSKNADFEIIYIEIDKHVHLAINQAALHFKKIEFNDLHDKAFFMQYKEGYGPSFVVIDEKGNIVTKHKKNTHQNNFSNVLTTFSNLLAKT